MQFSWTTFAERTREKCLHSLNNEMFRFKHVDTDIKFGYPLATHINCMKNFATGIPIMFKDLRWDLSPQ